jgi:hypothetical protein
MTYILPHLSEILTVHLIDLKSLNENPERLKLATMLTKMSNLIEIQNQSGDSNKEELCASLVGAYMYCLESIAQEYHLHSPEFKNGYMYNSGSPLYSILAKVLKLCATNQMTTRERLIYINKFHQFIEKHKDSVDEQLKVDNLNHVQLLINIRSILIKQLNLLTNKIAKTVNAIPTEKAITIHMEKLPQNYSQKKAAAHSQSWFGISENRSRIFLTQLVQAISTIKCQEEENLPPHIFTRSQRIKMGALLYITSSIANEYYIRSPNNSVLYTECRNLLNAPKEDNLDETQRLACLNAFKSYIEDHTARGVIEDFGLTHFKTDKTLHEREINLLVNIDTVLENIARQIDSMQASLNKSLMSQWPLTTTFATIGMILGAVPGYGVGSAIGLDLSEGQSSHPYSKSIGQGVGRLATAYFGRTSLTGYFAFLAGDFIIASTLSRAFAKVFEVVGMAAGGVVGGAVGFTFELTYKGLREACIRYLEFYDHHPDQMRNADAELIRCLLELPPELFSLEKQNRIKYSLGDNEAVEKKVMIN